MRFDPDVDPISAIREAIAANDSSALSEYLSEAPSSAVSRVVSLLSEAERPQLLSLLQPDVAADVFEGIPDAQAALLVEQLDPAEAAAIVDRMPSNEQADLLGDIPSEDAEAILDEFGTSEASDIRQLLSYPEDTAGGVMVTEFLSYPATMTISDLREDLADHAEEYSDYDIQYLYVTDKRGELVGVLRQRDLLFARRHTTVAETTIPGPHRVSVDTPLSQLNDFFREHTLLAVPVTDEDGRMVGVVRRRDVDEEVEKSSGRTFLRFSGIVGGEELRSMALFTRSSRRLSWLSLNIVLNVIAASVIVMYQDTLSQVIALAVFLPIISDMSGCSGNQAVAVSMRELTLGVTTPRDFLRVLLKESPLGIINGLALGTLLGLAAGIWQGNFYLGLVVGGALMANTLVAVSLGGLIPLALKRFNLDPALVSAPILTTVTDMCGFFFVLRRGPEIDSHFDQTGGRT